MILYTVYMKVQIYKRVHFLLYCLYQGSSTLFFKAKDSIGPCSDRAGTTVVIVN